MGWGFGDFVLSRLSAPSVYDACVCPAYAPRFLKFAEFALHKRFVRFTTYREEIYEEKGKQRKMINQQLLQ
jgi:hypothetical protein